MITRIKGHAIRNFIQAEHIKEDIDVESVVTPKHVEGFKYPGRKFKCKTCNKYGHFTSLCYKKEVSFKSRTPRHISCLEGNSLVLQESASSDVEIDL